MKTFKYKNYKNCYFIVGSYVSNPQAIAISIENQKDGPIATCTIYDELAFYSSNFATIKNYSENSHMTDFLKTLGVVVDTIDRRPCNHFVANTLYSNNPQTIDTCLIDIDVLKNYCKEWYYNV